MFAPRLGVAWRPRLKSAAIKDVVIRAGYGMNYNTGQYATFARSLSHQVPFANTQTNAVITPTVLAPNPTPTGCRTTLVAKDASAPRAGTSEHDAGEWFWMLDSAVDYEQLRRRQELPARHGADLQCERAEDDSAEHRAEHRLQRVTFRATSMWWARRMRRRPAADRRLLGLRRRLIMSGRLRRRGRMPW